MLPAISSEEGGASVDPKKANSSEIRAQNETNQLDYNTTASIVEDICKLSSDMRVLTSMMMIFVAVQTGPTILSYLSVITTAICGAFWPFPVLIPKFLLFLAVCSVNMSKEQRRAASGTEGVNPQLVSVGCCFALAVLITLGVVKEA